MSKIALSPNASGTGTFSIASPGTNTDRTLTLPDATGTVNVSGLANEVPAGSAGAPAIYPTGDTNTGVFFPAADTVAVATGGSERMRVTPAGSVGINTTTPNFTGFGGITATLNLPAATNGGYEIGKAGNLVAVFGVEAGTNDVRFGTTSSAILGLWTNNTERARITSAGDLFVAKTEGATNVIGIEARAIGLLAATRDGAVPLLVNRLTSDGSLVELQQGSTTEGTISVSGTTVSYNGGHLSRWAQFPDNSRPELLKGTVMSNLDQMSNWDNEDNEQLNCVEVSAVEGDANVAGVFVAWDTTDDDYNDILLGMTGDMVIRIAGGTTVQRGDLLMSAGDGTAKPQGDDIVRSKTIAKVTSTHISHTYADGSYAVPCVLMAC
jgi:hypothetical protein